MLLKEIAIPKTEVVVQGDDTLTVYGLTLESITDLLATHAKDISAIFNGEADPISMVSEAPLLAAKVIALACREPDSVEAARNIPVGTQIKILEAAWDLTLPDPDSLGKLLSRLEGMLHLPSPAPKESALSGNKTPNGNGNETSEVLSSV
jgi:hypothetical protein